MASYGVPAHGRMSIELLDNAYRLDRQEVSVERGQAHCEFTAGGEGLLSLNLQMVGDAGRTATVPILGSKKQQREQTLFSRLGTVVGGSLLPGKETREARGLFLQEMGVETSPFRLEKVDSHTARLKALTTAKQVCLVLANPSDPDDVQAIRRDEIQAGEVLELETSGVLSIVGVGAFVKGKPWEGTAAIVPPTILSPQIRVPEKVAPGTEIPIEIKTGTPSEASVYVVVKDARLASQDAPKQQLASSIKRYVENHPPALGDVQGLQDRLPTPPPQPVVTLARRSSGGLLGFVEQMLGATAQDGAAGMRSFTASNEMMSFRGGYMDALPAPSGAKSASMMEGVVAFASAEDTGVFPALSKSSIVEVEPPPTNQDEQAEVVFAGLLSTTDGKASVKVPLGNQFAQYVVEAFVLTDHDWEAAEARFSAEKSP
ncbi:MAG: hypothetical protein KDA84_20885, partial [Planctomycetaceae bacterium]|nr:hypothetical protein [Planctomycetaceae bacterium]